MPNTRYESLVDYMERTGTTSRRLLEMVYEITGKRIKPSLFSMILRGSRRCSKVNAWLLHTTTGVPMDELTRWPRYTGTHNSVEIAQGHHE